MTFFRLVRYVTQYHSDEFQDDTLKTSKKVILPFKSSQKIPEDNTLRGYPKIPGHFEKTKNFNKTLEFLVFFLYKKNHPKRKERNHLRTHLLTVFNGGFKTRCCCCFLFPVWLQGRNRLGRRLCSKIGTQKIDVRWCLLAAVRSMRSCWKEMHNKLVWMHQWRRLGEMTWKKKRAMGTESRSLPMVFFDRKKSLLVKTLGIFFCTKWM